MNKLLLFFFVRFFPMVFTINSSYLAEQGSQRITKDHNLKSFVNLNILLFTKFANKDIAKKITLTKNMEKNGKGKN